MMWMRQNGAPGAYAPYQNNTFLCPPFVNIKGGSKRPLKKKGKQNGNGKKVCHFEPLGERSLNTSMEKIHLQDFFVLGSFTALLLRMTFDVNQQKKRAFSDLAMSENTLNYCVFCAYYFSRGFIVGI